MRCLIQGGDARRVMAFAAKTKHRESCVLAANYLASLDWHADASGALTKAILGAYNAAKAYAQLAAFYDAMALK